jgi:hypothetical protein
MPFRNPHRTRTDDEDGLDATQPLELVQLTNDVLERVDAVPQTRSIFEAQLVRELAQLRAQRGQRRDGCLPLDALQRSRCEVRAPAAT